MSHLSLETIARLVDEQPNALDNAHLEACAACRAELASMRADVAALGTLPDVLPADDSWDAIEARLEAEGLLRARTDIVPLRRRTWSPLARAAAVAAVFVGGTLVGHSLNGSPHATSGSLASVSTTADQSGNAVSGTTNGASAPSSQASTPTSTAPAQTPGATVANNDAGALQNAPRSSVRLASTGNAEHTRSANTSDKSTDAALRTLRDAEDKYFSALTNYSAKAGTETSDPNARLAALEGIVLTTRAALAQSPTDPVINGYHLTALAQRDAMLKQIKATPAKSW